MWNEAASTRRGQIGPYEIERELGRGAMSVVYRASRNGKTFAVKVLTATPVVDGALARVQFRREAAALARLRHPSLVRVVEVGEAENRPYLVMNFIEGETLAVHIARGVLSDEETLTIARSIASALAEVHRFGLVHRDVKPDNIILGTDRVAQLIDFGLVSEAPDSDAVVGTPRYASPEQLGVLKRAVGATADLYSLGATLYECVAGVPPLGVESADITHRIAVVAPSDLRELRPGCRPALAAIIAKLLSKDPDDRYQSAQGLLRDLDAITSIDEALRGGASVELGLHDAPISSDQQVPILGRERELDRITRALMRSRRGELSFVQVEGESGAGKTCIVRKAADVAAESGAMVLFGRCQELETAPFGALRAAIEHHVSVVQRMPHAQRMEAITRLRVAAGEWAPLVRRLAPGLGELLNTSTEIRVLEPGAEHQRYYNAIAGFFLGLGTHDAPLFLVLDDVQWIDEGSLTVLARMASRPESSFCAVAATARGGSAERQRFADAVSSCLVDRVDLGPLNRESIDALVRARLNGHSLPTKMFDRLVALTSGNPFAVEECLRALIESGALRPTLDDGWVEDPEAFNAVKLPSDVAELVERRIASLGEQTANVAATAAMVGAQFSVSLVTRALRLDAAEVAYSIEQMVREGLVEWRASDRCAFVHTRVREAALERLNESRRRQIHQAIAETMDRAAATADELYALARHWSQGHPERNPRRASEVCLAAGQHALREHANEEAFDLLSRALDMALRAGTYDEHALPLREGLGRACAFTGRLEQAYAHLEEGIKRARDRADRFRLQHLLVLTYASQGRNDEALSALYQAFRVLGRALPRWSGVQFIATIAMWIFALALRWTGIGYGRARDEAREQRKVLSQLHYAGSMIALFQGRPFLMIQFIVRDFYNVHFLGETAETAIASSVYGAVLGTFQLGRTMRYYTKLGVEMAERLGDRAAQAVSRAYEAVGTKWVGELSRGNELLVSALPSLHQHAPGSWYAAMMICEQAYSYLHTGHARAAIDHARAMAPQLERTNNLMFRYNTRSVLYAELMVAGEVEAASALWRDLEAEYQRLSSTIYVRLARCIAVLEVLVDQEETGPEVDEAIEVFQDLVSEDYYSNAARMLTGYARMIQFQRARSADRARARQRFEAAVRSLKLRALVPVFRCHVYVWEAALARADEGFDRARTLLDRAVALATHCQSRRGLYYAALERARLARDRGEPAAAALASEAFEIALAEHWRNKAATVRNEFKLGGGEIGSGRASSISPVVVSRATNQAKRYVDALLQVSLASASTLDGDAVARNALEEVARVLGAERALFFLLHPETKELTLKASVGDGVESTSRTVVRKVVETRAPVILTGTDAGEALGAQSVVTYGLRSVIAAPLMLRERMIGVVYLDSRLAKGMFTEDDLMILRGVANHIAIAVETANAARLEAERIALQRDIELVGAVQKFLLPKARAFEVGDLKGASYYRPASKCGGDWWWHEVDAEGALLLLLGDVTGHGAAPAMITSSVAGAYHALRRARTLVTPPEILRELDRRVRDFGGEFHMTMCIVRIDPKAHTLQVWNAAGPGLFIERRHGSEWISAPGSLLGDSATLVIGEATVPFRDGDRLLMCTDGLVELRATNGRQLGARRVQRFFTTCAHDTIGNVPQRLANEIDRALGSRTQDDDITFIVVEASTQTSDDRT